MLTLSRMVSIAFAAVVLVVVISVCGEAFACSGSTSSTCCTVSSHHPCRDLGQSPSICKVSNRATTVSASQSVCAAVIAGPIYDARLKTPPPDLLIANMRI